MRRYLTPRSLGLLAVAVVLMAVMVALGLWQLGAYDDQQRDDVRAVAQRAPVPLDEALGPDDGLSNGSVGQPVNATGTYLADQQLYVRGYPGAGRDYAVVTPLLTGSGSAILVLRGTSNVPAATSPKGRVSVEGVLELPDIEGSPLDAARITNGIRVSGLVQDLDHDLYSGYVVLRVSDPSDQLPTITAPPTDPARWAGIRNLLYALQWWVFAGFVAFMWWRIVSDSDAPAAQPVG